MDITAVTPTARRCASMATMITRLMLAHRMATGDLITS
jgi:hypothetical protein